MLLFPNILQGVILPLHHFSQLNMDRSPGTLLCQRGNTYVILIDLPNFFLQRWFHFVLSPVSMSAFFPTASSTEGIVSVWIFANLTGSFNLYFTEVWADHVVMFKDHLYFSVDDSFPIFLFGYWLPISQFLWALHNFGRLLVHCIMSCNYFFQARNYSDLVRFFKLPSPLHTLTHNPASCV